MENIFKIAIARLLMHEHVTIQLTETSITEAISQMQQFLQGHGLGYTRRSSTFQIRSLKLRAVSFSKDVKHIVGRNQKSIIQEGRTPTRRDINKWNRILAEFAERRFID